MSEDGFAKGLLLALVAGLEGEQIGSMMGECGDGSVELCRGDGGLRCGADEVEADAGLEAKKLVELMPGEVGGGLQVAQGGLRIEPLREVGGNDGGGLVAATHGGEVRLIVEAEQLGVGLQYVLQLTIGAGLDEELRCPGGDLPLLPEDVEVDLVLRVFRRGLCGAAGDESLKILHEAERAAVIAGGGGEAGGELGVGQQAGLKHLGAGDAGLQARGFEGGIVEDGERDDGGLVEAA